MIQFCSTSNKYQFTTTNHNIDKGSDKPLIYNQLFVDDQLYILNTNTGEIYTNYIDLNLVLILKQYNFNPNGRFRTTLNGKTVTIHELIFGVKTNGNFVINHIDGDCTNNRKSNLELVTNWFNTALQKKDSGLPIGITYTTSGNYQTVIGMPRVHGKQIKFGSKSIDYLQNIHYQFGVKSGLVTTERYLQSTPNWIPDNPIQFTPEHRIKLDELIAAHLENQSTWEQPINIT